MFVFSSAPAYRQRASRISGKSLVLLFQPRRVFRGIEEGIPISLEAAVYSLLPETGSVEVQRDTPERHHAKHTHPTHEILLIVSGSITFHLGEDDYVCTSGDRLYLPVNTLHASTAGEKGCLYVISIK